MRDGNTEANDVTTEATQERESNTHPLQLLDSHWAKE